MRTSKWRVQPKLANWLAGLRRGLEQRATKKYQKLKHRVKLWRADAQMQTNQGQRFLELKGLLEDFLLVRFSSDGDGARQAASQLLNVLRNCDSITYEEQGTAEAYALLHFLDRYHRFQLIFQKLSSLNLIPLRTKDVQILDVGTGPGPSMYAASDFFVDALGKTSTNQSNWGEQGFSIDYVERSRQFRNWLHHFTEHANYHCPTERPWWVPFHHGTFQDFAGLQFDSTRYEEDYDLDGEAFSKQVKVRRRFDLIVFSNFLTTKHQVQQFSTELQSCARYLRHKGILVVVGAPNRSRKYRDVYEEISRTVTGGRYSNKKLVARCFAVEIPDPLMKYSWSDPYGAQIKEAIARPYQELTRLASDCIPPDAKELLDQTLRPRYSKAIEWQVFVFRKWARPRK
jgi:hypothetical protein